MKMYSQEGLVRKYKMTKSYTGADYVFNKQKEIQITAGIILWKQH